MILLNSFTVFHPAPLLPFPLTAVSLFHVSTPVSILFISLFLYQISHISEIIWYLSFCDWLILLSIIIFKWLFQSAFPTTVQKCSPFSTSSPALVVC